MRILIGISGASGSIYGLKLIEELQKKQEHEVLVTATETGFKVCEYETDINIQDFARERKLSCYDINDLFAPPASGSFNLDAVVILPCSMGTLARIAHGISANLLERASDVVLKENKKLILSPRETPINSIHLKNMLTLSRAGAILAPVSPAFYTKPKTLDDIIHYQVGKVLNLLNIHHSLFDSWGDCND